MRSVSQWPAALTLMCLGIMVEVAFEKKKEAGTKRVAVNFLDLSVPRVSDAVYTDGGRKTVDAVLPRVRMDKVLADLPFASLSDVYETTSRLLQQFAHKVLEGLRGLPPTPPDSPYAVFRDSLEAFLVQDLGRAAVRPAVTKAFKKELDRDALAEPK